MHHLHAPSPRHAIVAPAVGALVTFAVCALSACPGPMPTTAEGGSTTMGTGTGGTPCIGTNNTDPSWANWPMPNPAAAALPNKATYEVDALGLTVTDKVTGLVWERKSSLRTLDGAATHCAGLKLNGVTGFRLPTRIELYSILDYTIVKPAIDPVFVTVSEPFGNPATTAYFFWTSFQAGADVNYQVVVDFTFGTSSAFLKSASIGARCVAGPFH